MSDFQTIEGKLRDAAQRCRWQRGWSGAWKGFLIGSAVWLLALIVFKLAPIPFNTLIWSSLAWLISTVVGFGMGFSRELTLSEIARWIDQKEQLKERLSTALEVAGKSDGNAWKDLVIADAAGHVNKFDARKQLPWHLPAVSRWALLVVALAAGLGFVPEYRSPAYAKKQQESEIIKETGRQVAELTKRQKAVSPPVLEPTQKAMDATLELGERLQKQTLTREEALRDLAKVTDAVKEQNKEMMAKNPAFKRMEQAARSASGQPQQSAADLQKKIEQLKNALGEKADPAAVEKLKDKLEQLQKAAQDMAKDGGLSSEEQKELSDSMASLSQQAAEAGLSVPMLDKAIEALAAQDVGLFLKDLDLSMLDLEKMSQMAKQLAKFQGELMKMGKDLAEQLEKGQAQVATMRLSKMMKELNSASMSKEQLEKMTEEVQRAVKPAGDYGKVSEKLQRAAEQMKSGQKAEAAQSLADAKKELEELMKQAGECQNMAAMLQALQMAGMCIGNCQGWGQCNGPPKAGLGGKPGSGVGTWADDDSFEGMVNDTSGWDNSGVDRPDTDARGQTERDVAIRDGFTPDKVKGQFSPGGQMPSITLKGVSIKGESKVAYQEAAAAAQSEAESALSQEKVPRAYQGAVKGYFDDFDDLSKRKQ